MIDRIKGILNEIDGITAWKIIEVSKTSEELFFIKKKLDMNRSIDIHIYDVTIYVEFEEDGKSYLGQSRTEISATMTDEDIKAIFEDVKLGASFVKNQFYELVEPSEEASVIMDSSFSEGELMDYMPLLAKAVYGPDIHEAGGINSCEIFLNRHSNRFVNSKGINVSYTTYTSMVEVITEWNDGEEPVELYEFMNLGDYEPNLITEKVTGMIEQSKLRAHAKPAPTLSDMNVILSGEAVKEFLEYYVVKANAQSIYEKTSNFEIGQSVQGADITGDQLQVELLPSLEGSSKSRPYDEDGFLLKPLTLIKDGVLQTYYGSKQYTYYLDIEPTGLLRNARFACGDMTYDRMKNEPYIELISFSNFQMNPLTGDFGGEVRLANYYDGEKIVAITGASISSNISVVQGNMKLSKEIMKIDNYEGPGFIYFKGLDIAGV